MNAKLIQVKPTVVILNIRACLSRSCFEPNKNTDSAVPIEVGTIACGKFVCTPKIRDESTYVEQN